jgi:lipopolysaccharide export system ATP-binding protein
VTRDEPTLGKSKAPSVRVSTLSARKLHKEYKKRAVVKDVSLDVRAGEIVGLLGPNGAGKTTTFYIVSGLVAADSGVIELDGEDITALPMHARARLGIGYLPQEPSIFRRLSVSDNIMAILELRKDLDGKGRKRELDQLLTDLHITQIRDSEGQSLSGGERRRAEIARALAANPRFILLDEPFAGVDPIAVADIQNIVHHLRDRGIGVLITDHNVRETLGICSRACILAEGSVIAEGAPADLLQNETVRRVYLGEQFKL